MTLSFEQLLASRSRALSASASAAMSQQQIDAQLAVLPQWHLQNSAITRCYSFSDYYQTIAFVNALAYVVHAEDHHPDLEVSYNRCTVRFNTHSVKGISLNDFICAAKAETLYTQTAQQVL